MDLAPIDPYVYPGSTVLINKLNIKDTQALEFAESHYFALRLSQGIPNGQLDYSHLKSIHQHIFQDVYVWAGKERTVSISKGGDTFASPMQISPYINNVLSKLKSENVLQGFELDQFCRRAAYYFGEINAVHPFREGNGRTQRLFLDKIAEKSGYKLSWNKVSRDIYIEGSIKSFHGDTSLMKDIFSTIIRPIDQKRILRVVPPSPQKQGFSSISAAIIIDKIKNPALAQEVMSKIQERAAQLEKHSQPLPSSKCEQKRDSTIKEERRTKLVDASREKTR